MNNHKQSERSTVIRIRNIIKSIHHDCTYSPPMVVLNQMIIVFNRINVWEKMECRHDKMWHNWNGLKTKMIWVPFSLSYWHLRLSLLTLEHRIYTFNHSQQNTSQKINQQNYSLTVTKFQSKRIFSNINIDLCSDFYYCFHVNWWTVTLRSYCFFFLFFHQSHNRWQ